MDLKRLLNLKHIDFEQVAQVVKNRKLLLDGLDEFIEPDFLKKLTSTEVHNLTYYTGDVDAIKRLIPFSNKNNIPLFPSDLIEVQEKERTKTYTSSIFFDYILDGLAQNDGFFTQSSGDALRIYNIQKIKIIKQDEKEIKELISSLEEIDLEKESLAMEEQLVTLINDLNSSFSRHKMYKDLNHLLSNLYVKDLSEYQNKKIESLIKDYLKTGNVFSLIEPIKVISNKV